MQVTIIKATDKRTSKIVFVEGLEDSTIEVQVIVPVSVFSKDEYSKLESGLSLEPIGEVNLNKDSKFINLGNDRAYNFTCNLENLKIEVVDIDLDSISFLEGISQNNNTVAVLTVVDKSTNKIVFAEGTDCDGYNSHQLTIPSELLCEKSKIFLSNNFEVKHLTGDYEFIKVEIKYFIA